MKGKRLLRLDMNKFITMMQWFDPTMLMRVEGNKLPPDCKLIKIALVEGQYVYLELYSEMWTAAMVQIDNDPRFVLDPPIFVTYKSDEPMIWNEGNKIVTPKSAILTN